MAAVEIHTFWKNRMDREVTVDPPEFWVRINTDLDYGHDDAYWGRVESWLASDEANGEFCWHYQYYLSGEDRKGSTWAFSDAVTAMAFKLRFG